MRTVSRCDVFEPTPWSCKDWANAESIRLRKLVMYLIQLTNRTWSARPAGGNEFRINMIAQSMSWDLCFFGAIPSLLDPINDGQIFPVISNQRHAGVRKSKS